MLAQSPRKFRWSDLHVDNSASVRHRSASTASLQTLVAKDTLYNAALTWIEYRPPSITRVAEQREMVSDLWCVPCKTYVVGEVICRRTQRLEHRKCG